MSNHKSSSDQCIQLSELTPKQLESLSFVPGTLDNFDEKEKLPPTARAQWNYVQLNPTDYLQRFTNELGLLGVNVAICFINKEIYKDSEKDLKTPITVYLIVSPDQYEEIKQHLVEKRLSHEEMEDQKGFALPFLGSIQKALDTLELESLLNYLFIKNSISRESYSTWISVPKSYLEVKKPATPMKKRQLENTEKNAAIEKENQKDPKTNPEPTRPSEARTIATVKENFNYVVYDDSPESTPSTTVNEERSKSNSVIIAEKPKPEKKSFLSKLKSGSKKKKTERVKKEKVPSPCPTAKYDSALFLSLGLFNFFGSVLLVAFLSSVLVEVKSIQLEATTFAAFVSLLLTMLVVRPTFKFPQSRLWSLGAYAVFAGITGYQILFSEASTDFSSYVTTAAVTIVCFTSALIAALKRVDRLSLRKNKKSKVEEKVEKEIGQSEVNEDTGLDEEDSIPTNPKNLVDTNLPPPKKPTPKNKTGRKVAMKSTKPKTEDKKPVEGPAPIEETPSPIVKPAAQRKPIPSQPISEEQKDVIRNRLARKDRHSAPASSNGTANSDNGSQASPKQLSTEEIKAQLASRLKRSSSIRNETKEVDNTESTEQSPNSEKNISTKRRTINLKKANKEKNQSVSN